MNPRPTYSAEECPSCNYDYDKMPDESCIIPTGHKPFREKQKGDSVE